MTLYKRSRSTHWQYDFTVHGKRYRGSTRKESKMAARSFEADLLKQIEEKGFSSQPQKRSTTLLAYMTRFQTWVDQSHQLKPTSKRYYRDGIAVLSRSSLAHVPLGAITADVVDTTTFHELSGAEASPHLSNSALATLRRLLNKAKVWGDLRDAPQVKLRAAQGRTALITGEIEDKLLAQLQKPEAHPRVRADRETLVDLYLMMHDAGMRTSEAVSARVELIDWEGKRLFNPRGKSKKAKRWIPLSDRLVSRLRVRCKGRAKGWVFPSTRGSRSGHLVSPQKGFRQACRDAGIADDILLYTGRHTFGTYAVQQTGNLFAVSDAMGHQDIKSMRPYQHHDTNLLAGVMNLRNESRHTLRHTEVPKLPEEVLNDSSATV